MTSSEVGWSCETLKEGYNAVLTEEEAALLEQEEEIMKEIKDSAFIPNQTDPDSIKKKRYYFIGWFLQPTFRRNWKKRQPPTSMLTRLPPAEESDSWPQTCSP